MRNEETKKVKNPEEERVLDTNIAKCFFEEAEKRLEQSFEDMVRRAQRLATDLEREKKYFMEAKKSGADNSLMSRADLYRSALRTVQNCFNNYDSQDAARYVSRYEKAEVYYKMLNGEKVNVW